MRSTCIDADQSEETSAVTLADGDPGASINQNTERENSAWINAWCGRFGVGGRAPDEASD